MGPCLMMIDKNSPPVADNMANTMNLKTKITIPDLVAHGGSPKYAAMNCTAIKLKNPTAYSGY